MQQIEVHLEQAIRKAGVGEFDGDEFGGGFCVLYMYGPDADKLAAVVLPILRSTRPEPGSYVVKRYGTALDLNAREETLVLTPTK
jgi:hypothetical protein